MKAHLTAACIAIFALTACEADKSGEIPISKTELLLALDDDSSETEEKQKPESAKPLLIARGSEPGWYAEFFSDRVRLQLNHGEIKKEIEYDFSDIASKKKYEMFFTSVEMKNGMQEKHKLSVKITPESCSEMSGEQRDRKISLAFDGVSYEGCAYSE